MSSEGRILTGLQPRGGARSLGQPDGPLAAENDITNCLQRPARVRFRVAAAPPATYHPASSHLSRSRQAHVPRGVSGLHGARELSYRISHWANHSSGRGS